MAAGSHKLCQTRLKKGHSSRQDAKLQRILIKPTFVLIFLAYFAALRENLSFHWSHESKKCLCQPDIAEKSSLLRRLCMLNYRGYSNFVQNWAVNQGRLGWPPSLNQFQFLRQVCKITVVVRQQKGSSTSSWWATSIVFKPTT